MTFINNGLMTFIKQMQNSWAKYQQLKCNIIHKGFSCDQVGYIPRIQHALMHTNQTHRHVIHTYTQTHTCSQKTNCKNVFVPQ